MGGNKLLQPAVDCKGADCNNTPRGKAFAHLLFSKGWIGWSFFMPRLHVDQGGKMQQSMVFNNLRVTGSQHLTKYKQ